MIPGAIPAAFYRAPDGKVWLPQTSGRLQSFDPTTLQVLDYRSPLTFAYSDMVVGPDGAFWLTDFGNNRLVRWTPGDATETSWVIADTSFGSLNPSQIQFDDQGFLWISELSANRMDRFNPSTNQLAAFTGINAPVHFDIFQDRIYITSSQTQSAVTVLDPAQGRPLFQTLASTTPTVGSTPETIPVTIRTSTITPTTFDSPETAVTSDKINVVTGVLVGSLTTNLTALTSTCPESPSTAERSGAGVDGKPRRIVPSRSGTPRTSPCRSRRTSRARRIPRSRVEITLSSRARGTISGDALYLFSPGTSPTSAPLHARRGLDAALDPTPSPAPPPQALLTGRSGCASRAETRPISWPRCARLASSPVGET